MFNIVLLLKVPHDLKKLAAKEDPFSENKQNLLAIVAWTMKNQSILSILSTGIGWYTLFLPWKETPVIKEQYTHWVVKLTDI